MKKLDLLVISLVLLLEVFLFVFLIDGFQKRINEDRYMQIYLENELMYSLKLEDNLEKKLLLLSKDDKVYDIVNVELDFEINDNLIGYDLVYIYNGGAQVVAADCKNRVVVNMGFTKHPNYPLICVPRNIVIRIIDKTKDNIIKVG
ncbi:MAG: NusG domain II-containing protein [Bacilli bacterium]